MEEREGRRRHKVVAAIVPPTEEPLLRDDQRLVQAGAHGDAAAFAELLRRHDPDMRGVVWRVVGSAAAFPQAIHATPAPRRMANSFDKRRRSTAVCPE